MALQILKTGKWLAMLALVTACSLPADENEASVPLGDFKLGHNIVVVDNPDLGPFSRKATDEQWQTAITEAMDKRFGGYDGDRFYHIGLKVDGYALAIPGVPILFSPKSALILTVNIWDDEKGVKLNDEPKRLTVFEGLSGETVIGSGLTQNKRTQLRKLSVNAAKAVEKWILQNPEWVGLPPLETEEAADPVN